MSWLINWRQDCCRQKLMPIWKKIDVSHDNFFNNREDYRPIDQVGRVFTNGPGDLGSIPGPVIAQTQKMVLDTSLLNTQHYKLRIKGE